MAADNLPWLKLYYKLNENPVSSCAVTLGVLVKIFLNSRRAERQFISQGKIISLEPGQMHIVQRDFAKGLKISIYMLRRSLQHLQDLEIINLKPQTKGTLITVSKFIELQAVPNNVQTMSKQCSNNVQTKAANTEYKNKDLRALKNVRVKECKNVRNKGGKAPPQIFNIFELTLKAHESGFQKVLGVSPIENEHNRSLIRQIIRRIGEDSPHVLNVFYTAKNDFYRQRGFDLKWCLEDCEKLHAIYQQRKRKESG